MELNCKHEFRHMCYASFLWQSLRYTKVTKENQGGTQRKVGCPGLLTVGPVWPNGGSVLETFLFFSHFKLWILCGVYCMNPRLTITSILLMRKLKSRELSGLLSPHNGRWAENSFGSSAPYTAQWGLPTWLQNYLTLESHLISLDSHNGRDRVLDETR